MLLDRGNNPFIVFTAAQAMDTGLTLLEKAQELQSIQKHDGKIFDIGERGDSGK
jgi:hypothetical protein